MPNMASTLDDTGIRKALLSTSLSVTKSYADFKLLISCWSVPTHTFISVWGEFTLTLKDVAVLSRLPLFGDHGAMRIVLTEEEERTLQLLNVALRVTSKST